MWQIQWMLNLIPEGAFVYLYSLILLAGVLALLANKLTAWLPGIGAYRVFLKYFGIVFTLLGVFLFGGYNVEASWKKQIAEMQDKVAKAEAEAALANRAIKEDLDKKTEVVKKKSETITKNIDRYSNRETLKNVQGQERVRIEEVIKYVENCPVPKELIDIHNEAARMNKNPEGESK